MRVGSLFSGIGGFDLGLERAGFQIEWQVENNDYCRKVLQKHWPAVPCHYDIKTIDWRYIPRVDLVCGGFPCQPFSCAGKRRGAEDDRYLWPEVVRCLSELQPTWFLGENVFGLLNLGIEQMYADLEAHGYQVTILGIPACGVDAPHIRQRIWILAYSDSNGSGSRWTECEGQQRQDAPVVGSGNVADAECSKRWEIHKACNDYRANGHAQRQESTDRAGGSGEDVPDSTGGSEQRSGAQCNERRLQNEDVCGSWYSRNWATEPSVLRVAHGVPHRVDRLRGLGNAIVPQIAEAIGKMILDIERSEP